MGGGEGGVRGNFHTFYFMLRMTKCAKFHPFFCFYFEGFPKWLTDHWVNTESLSELSVLKVTRGEELKVIINMVISTKHPRVFCTGFISSKTNIPLHTFYWGLFTSDYLLMYGMFWLFGQHSIDCCIFNNIFLL